MGEIIYRVQDSEGRGPYRPGFSHRWVDAEADDTNRRPFFEEFGHHVLSGMLYGQAAGSGFRSLRQLHTWFSDAELERLGKFGYKIVAISASRVLAESNNQLVFVCNVPLSEAAQEVELLSSSS